MLALMPREVVPLNRVPLHDPLDFARVLDRELHSGARAAAYFAWPLAGELRLLAVLAVKDGLRAASATVADGHFPAIASLAPQVHWFEREIAEQYNLIPEGHPWPKPVRFHAPFPGAHPGPAALGPNDRPGVTRFFAVAGEDVHEVAVGPVHAGVIEPGHFRFQCTGEVVHHLEISLGYQHRGVEQALLGGPDNRSIHLLETLAGDTTIGHTWAYCQILEALSGRKPAPRAELLRGLMLELERLANHVGDLGALAGDVGFLPTLSYCGRLRGDILNLSALVCGSRFGRSMLRPGGVAFDAEPARLDTFAQRFEATARDILGATDLLFGSASVAARFEQTGTVDQATAAAIGLVGPAARASGLSLDVRRDYPYGPYVDFPPRVPVGAHGDVQDRAMVRRLEVEDSFRLVREFLIRLASEVPGRAEEPPRTVPAFAPDALVVGLTEGWRGEVCHVALTGPQGRFTRYKVVDPSFHNWFGLALALRGQQISDFPLCNKSFNLSYCGHDL